MTETTSQLSARQGGLPPPSASSAPAAEAVRHTLLPQSQVEAWQEGQLGQAQPAQQTTAKAKLVGQLTLLKAYPTKRLPQVQQAAELADPWTELPELPMCAVTSPRVSSSKSTSQRQRSRLSYEQWLVAKNKADAQQRRRQRREQQRQRHEQLQRQQLAAHSFKLWLKGKQRQQSLPRIAAGSAVSSSSNSNNASLPADVASRRYVAMWQRRKLAELATQRASQQQRQQQQQLRNDLRRQLSDLAFERWLAQSAVRRQLKLGTWRAQLQQQQQQQQQGQQQRQQQQRQQQQRQQQQRQQQQRQQQQWQQLPRQAAAEPYSLYLHVPLSAAQQALRDRLQDMNAVKVQHKRRL